MQHTRLARAIGAATMMGLIAGLALALPASGAHKSAFVNKTKVASSGNLTLALPDPVANGAETDENIARSQIKPGGIPNRARVKDVNVSVRLDHASDRDVNLFLASPKGVINLTSDNGGTGDDFGTGADDCSGQPTVFDSQATSLVTTGLAPFAGSFQPEEPLAQLNGLTGKVAKQPWTLVALDDNQVGTGTLFCWKLQIKYRAHK